VTEAPFAVEPAPHRHPRVGYVLAASASILWAVNGTVSKVILASGLSSLRLTQVRSAGAFVGFVLVLLVIAPSRLRAKRRELPFLAAFGLVGLACVQMLYFLSIHRLAVGIALLVEYLGALLVALWARYVFHEQVRRRIWAALGLALVGLSLIVDLLGGGEISSAGLGFALGAAFAYAAYLLLAERGVGGRDAVSLLAWGFGFATLLFAIVAPWWSFPGGVAGDDVSLLGHLDEHSMPVWALILWVIVPGTIVPFFLLVSALRHLPATRVGIIAMLEPVAATVVAWAWLGESLGAQQLLGAAIVLAAIVLAQTAR